MPGHIFNPPLRLEECYREWWGIEPLHLVSVGKLRLYLTARCTDSDSLRVRYYPLAYWGPWRIIWPRAKARRSRAAHEEALASIAARERR